MLLRPLGLLFLSLSAPIAIASRPAHGCPSCPTQLEARAEVFDESPLKWLLVMVSPFVVIGGVATMSYRLGRRLPRSDR